METKTEYFPAADIMAPTYEELIGGGLRSQGYIVVGDNTCGKGDHQYEATRMARQYRSSWQDLTVRNKRRWKKVGDAVSDFFRDYEQQSYDQLPGFRILEKHGTRDDKKPIYQFIPSHQEANRLIKFFEATTQKSNKKQWADMDNSVQKVWNKLQQLEHPKQDPKETLERTKAKLESMLSTIQDQLRDFDEESSGALTVGFQSPPPPPSDLSQGPTNDPNSGLDGYSAASMNTSHTPDSISTFPISNLSGNFSNMDISSFNDCWPVQTYQEINDLIYGMNRVKIDLDRALAIAKISNNDPVMVAYQGYLYGWKGRKDERQKLMESSVELGLFARAEGGCPYSQFFTGYLFYSGLGKTFRSHETAHFWYEKASTQNLTAARYILGSLHERSKNYSSAIDLYTDAAGKGCAAAQFSLGFLYAGKGLMKEAAQRFQQAADQGCARSRDNLSVILKQCTPQ